MNRLQFIKTTKSALLFLPLVRYFNVIPFGKRNNPKTEEVSPILFPDKENYLTAATCLFGTPGWGDGKNGDDSYVDVYVDVECYDNLYSAHGGFGDNTEIETNVIREMGIGFSAPDSKKIFYDGVKNINISILGHKPNQSGGRNDEWNIRWEFLMQFKKGNIIATGYNDPAISYEFTVEQTPINNPNTIRGRKSFFDRTELTDHRTLYGPIG